MNVRSVISVQPGESIADFEECALDNLLAGGELITRGYVRAGIYLLGGAAEMFLKSAYYRYCGKAAGDAVTFSDLQTAKMDAQNRFSVGVAEESFHSLRFWGILLINRRTQETSALPARVEYDLQGVVERLYQNWHISMRYRNISPIVLAPVSVLEDVEWLCDNHKGLWS
jgi:hypothetical protein